MTNPTLLQCARSRCKTCPFIQNANEIVRSPIVSRGLRQCHLLHNQWTPASTLYKKLYIGETGRRQGDRFREHLRDVEKEWQSGDIHASQSLVILISLTTPNNTCQSAAFPFIKVPRKVARINLEQKFIF